MVAYCSKYRSPKYYQKKPRWKWLLEYLALAHTMRLNNGFYRCYTMQSMHSNSHSFLLQEWDKTRSKDSKQLSKYFISCDRSTCKLFPQCGCFTILAMLFQQQHVNNGKFKRNTIVVSPGQQERVSSIKLLHGCGIQYFVRLFLPTPHETWQTPKKSTRLEMESFVNRMVYVERKCAGSEAKTHESSVSRVKHLLQTASNCYSLCDKEAIIFHRMPLHTS